MIQNRTTYICLRTDSEIANSFCLRYWARLPTGKWSESFQSLLKDSGLSKGEMVDMLKSACRLHFPHIRCSSCGAQISVATRSEYSSIIGTIQRLRNGKPSAICAACTGAAPALEDRPALFALKHRRDHLASALMRLHEKAKPVDYANLTFVQSFLLYAALLAANLAAGETVVPPLERQLDELAPTPELAEEIYARLCTEGIFLPAQASDINAFSLEKDTGAVTCSIHASTWTLARDACGRSIDEILTVLFRRLDQPEPAAIEALWYLVAEGECRRYFISQWERYRFAHPDINSAKVSLALQPYLDQCSVGQLWNVIYYAVKNLAALTQEGKYTPQHIYNMLPGGIRRYADYRLANGQTIRPWHRPSPRRLSWITNLLLDKVLKAGDIAFEMLKGQDVVKYVDYLVMKPRDGDPATWFARTAA